MLFGMNWNVIPFHPFHSNQTNMASVYEAEVQAAFSLCEQNGERME